MGLNKKVIGLMNDEMGGDIIEEFAALRPKLYSYRVGSKEHKKCKGIKKNVVKKTLMFEDYKDCLFNKTNVLRSELLFTSYRHDVHMIEVNKLALSSDDDKRVIQPDGLVQKQGAITYHNIYLSLINITNSECNQDVTLCLQELTSTLLIQMLSQAHLLGNTSHDYPSLPQFLSICKPS